MKEDEKKSYSYNKANKFPFAKAGVFFEDIFGVDINHM